MFGALLTDLSKAFDYLNHDLLIVKLNAYGFSFPALRLVHDYLLNRKQRKRINNSYSTWMENVFGVPQGSILDNDLMKRNANKCHLFVSSNE